MSASNLIELLKTMAGKEPSKMSESKAKSFRDDMMEQFRQATGFISGIIREVAGDSANRYMPSIIQPDPKHYGLTNDWLGYYQLRETDSLDDFLDKPVRIQLAASMFIPVVLKLNLFAEAHHPGYSHKPHVELVIESCCDIGLDALEMSIEEFAQDLQKAYKKGISFDVVSREGAMVNIHNPEDIVAAFKKGAKAVRKKAQKDPLDEAESMAIEVRLDANNSQETFEEVIWVGVVLFHLANQGLTKLRTA